MSRCEDIFGVNLSAESGENIEIRIYGQPGYSIDLNRHLNQCAIKVGVTTPGKIERIDLCSGSWSMQHRSEDGHFSLVTAFRINPATERMFLSLLQQNPLQYAQTLERAMALMEIVRTTLEQVEQAGRRKVS